MGRDAAERVPRAVQQMRYPTEQVAEEVARTRLRCDVQDDLVEIDNKAEQIEMQWAEHEIENVASRGRHRQEWAVLRTGRSRRHRSLFRLR
jgi:hypothetical protein